MALIVVIALLAQAAPAHAAFPGQNGKILFEGVGFGPGAHSDIYTMSPDGSGVQQLTNDVASDGDPAWSADGARIAFRTRRDGNDEIYVMGADGSGQTRITNHPGFDGWPSWSPDGTRIAFSSNRDGDTEIYTMNTDGSGILKLTDDTSPDLDPAWSPDGRRIAFSHGLIDPFGDSGPTPYHVIYVMNADGSAQVQVTFFERETCGYLLSDSSPNWSPDGGRIVFHKLSYDDGDYCVSIHSMNPDGTGLTTLARSSGWGYPWAFNGPVWAPDGTKIAYSEPGAGAQGVPTQRIRIVNPDGTGGVAIAPAGVSTYYPDWQPIANRPPDCSNVAADPSLLWPPNRRLRLVELSGATDPDGDAVSLEITGVTQDERVTGARDALRASESAVRLRAKRDPRGDGRVYRVAFSVADAKGAECQGTASVTVPRHKRETAIDSAPPSYNSFGH